MLNTRLVDILQHRPNTYAFHTAVLGVAASIRSSVISVPN